MTTTVTVAVAAGTASAVVRVRTSNAGAGTSLVSQDVVVPQNTSQAFIIGPDSYIEDVREVVKGQI